MKIYKKFIAGFLALNSMMVSYGENLKTETTKKYDRIYENMIRNINRGRPNNNSYKSIERILKQKK